MSTNTQVATPDDTGTDVDVVVVGAGFAGLYALHRLRGLGFTVRVLEAGTGVGGTWFWNRYPGARCDVESIDYSYSFSEELQQEWVWGERYARQPEILAYLQHVAERFDLLRDILFETRVSEAVYLEDVEQWRIVTTSGEEVRARFCIMAAGSLSSVKTPDFDGLADFSGEWHHTARWPEGGVDFAGKRVAVIGTGSTGIQAIPVIAAAAGHLTVFQRTPNFSVPARNRELGQEELSAVKATYAERRLRARRAPSGVPSDVDPAPARGVPLEERRRTFEAGWARGGAPHLLRSYSDLLTDIESNDSIADFVREKIHETVRDSRTADLLSPVGYPFGAKRLCVDTSYYETYNRDNVLLVSLQESPIERIVESGIQTADGVHEVDAIVFAIGFDAITGALGAIDIRGRGGESLSEHWARGPQALLGLGVSGFPNMFLVNGPGSPAVLGNAVTFIEHHVEWISDCLECLRDQGATSIEAVAEAETAWAEHVDEVAAGTLYPRARSWFLGANIPGKPVRFLPYPGGFDRYSDRCATIAQEGYSGFEVREAVGGDAGSGTVGGSRVSGSS